MVIERAQIDSHLDKILASAEFVRSERMARFLRFVVQLSLEGRAEELKERAIGTEVFDRPADWDPKLDTIVRSEARRLRNKLDSYYATAGGGEPIRIRIPKGGYGAEIDFLGEVETAAPEPDSVTIIPELPRRRWVIWFALAGSLLLAGGAWWWARDREIRAARADSFEIVPFATEFGVEIGPSISPDGKTIAYAWDGNDANYDIYLQSTDQKKTGEAARTRFTDSPQPEVYPKWSPDGRQIAFLRGDFRGERGSIAVVVKPLAGGPERMAGRVEFRSSGWLGGYGPLGDIGPAWTRDGKALLVEDATPGPGTGLFRIDLATGRRQQITNTERAISDFMPRVSPDGKQVAFVRYFSHGVSDIFVTPMGEDKPVQLTFARRTITGLDWTPDGKRLVYASWRQGSAQLWSVGAAGEDPKRIISDSGSVADLSVAPSGDWVAYDAISENWNVWRAPLERTPAGSVMGKPERFLSSSGKNHGPSFSPDGRRLAFISDRSGAWEIWLGEPDSSHMRRITHFNGPFLGSITWTPDSKTIAFDSRPGGNSNIFLMSVEGGEPRALAANSFEERMPRFSRDGRAIYFNSDRDGQVKVWRTTLPDQRAIPVGKVLSFASNESWDGKYLYYNLHGGEIWQAQTDGSKAEQLPGVKCSPELNWALGPSGLYFTRQERPEEAEFCLYTNGRVRVLGTAAGRLLLNTSNLAVSPDEKWISWAQQDHFTSDINIRRGALGK